VMNDLSKLSIEQRSNVEERKLTILSEYGQYMEDHPELRQVLNDFMCAVMTEKPSNIYKFARYWFSMSLPPLDAVSTAGTIAAKRDNGLDGTSPGPEETTLESIMLIAPFRLLSLVYTTIDSDADKTITKKEFQFSPLYGVWPEELWDRMDADDDGVVTPTEFFTFMRQVEAEEGKEKFHETVAKFIWEAGIEVARMLPPADEDELKAKVRALDKEKLRDYLFKSAVHQGVSEEERDFVYKKEMQHSKIGQMMLPYWSSLDDDGNGKITKKEWGDFFEKVDAMSAHLKEMRVAGEEDSLIVDLFLDGKYDVNDVQ